MSDRDTKDLAKGKGKGKRVAREAPTERLRPVGSEPSPEFKTQHVCGAKPKGVNAEIRQVPPRGWVLRVRRGFAQAFDIPIAGCPWCLRELEAQR